MLARHVNWLPMAINTGYDIGHIMAGLQPYLLPHQWHWHWLFQYVITIVGYWHNTLSPLVTVINGVGRHIVTLVGYAGHYAMVID